MKQLPCLICIKKRANRRQRASGRRASLQSQESASVAGLSTPGMRGAPW